MTLPPQEAAFDGAVTFGSGGLRPGRYDALLVDARGAVLSRSTFWVVRRAAQPRIAVRGPVRAGRSIRLAWRNAPAYRRDWVGIWKAGDPDLYNDYLTFAYTEATVDGVTRIAGDRRTFPPGRYVARLLKDDGYGVLASARFRVARR